MRRATILTLALALALVGGAVVCDNAQRSTAIAYRKQAFGLREMVDRGEMDKALTEQAYLHALWQHEEKWLNCIISHSHTRDVSASLTRLSTALENRWRDEALRELDALDEALGEIELSDWPMLENIL